MNRTHCPTTGLRSFATAGIGSYVADEMWNLSGAAHEAWPCPDTDHWHVRQVTPEPNRARP